MVVSPEPEDSLAPVLATSAEKRRRHTELLTGTVFRPLASVVVRGLLPLQVPPVAVVLANATAGLAAAAAIARGQLVVGALLLQLKTVLDNADGQLARVSGRASVLGRYLDTEADLVVNAALFAALAYDTSPPLLAVAALVALTLVLSADFNEDVMHRRTRGEAVVTEPSAQDQGVVARVLARLYHVVFAPQDRALQAIARQRLERLPRGVTAPELRDRATLAYYDDATSAILANLGLSTQLAILGVLLVLGVPTAYLWFTLGCLAVLPLVQLRRELAARRVLRTRASG